jgi:hypothetical protein
MVPASEDDLSPPMTVALGGEATRKNAGDASFLSDENGMTVRGGSRR